MVDEPSAWRLARHVLQSALSRTGRHGRTRTADLLRVKQAL
jgi:hypothetical protein